MSFFLEIQEGGTHKSIELAEPELKIGRGADNHVVLSDPRSSRHHCRVLTTPQGLLLEDLESRNGTLLNGSPATKCLLKEGDEFRIGNARFVLKAGSTSPRDAGGGKAGTSQEGSARAPSAGLVETRYTPAPGRSTEPAERGIDLDDIELPEDLPGDVPAEGDRVFLECVQGEHAGKEFPVDKLPFVLGRGKECGLRLQDPRASSRHARVVQEGDGFYLEDLDSRNGTFVNKRVVKRAPLGTGAMIQVGNTTLRFHGPGAASAEMPPEATEEEFVRLDVEKFLSRDRSEHPLAVGALVLILAIVGYFAVDVTRRLVVRPPVDPPQEANLIGRNWSFEDEREIGSQKSKDSESPPAVVAWKAEGQGARIEVTPERAQLPGAKALRLVSGGEGGLARATHESDLLMGSERRFRIEGYVFNEGAFAAGFLVEWLRAAGGKTSTLGFVFSETARQTGEAIDVDQVFTAHPLASRALVSCFILGSGSAVFDRVSLAVAPQGGEAAAAVPGREAPAEDGASTEGKTWAYSRAPSTLRIGPKESPLLTTVEPDGTISVLRRQKLLVPALWAALSPEADPRAFGPRLVSPRWAPGDGSSLLFVCEVPDEQGRAWATVETSVLSGGDDVIIRWRTSRNADKGEPVKLALYMEGREGGPAPLLHPAEGGGAVQEVVLGEKLDRASLRFATPLEFASRPHPFDPGKVLWVADAGKSEIELSLSHTSRHELSAVQAEIQRAEEAFRAGKVGAGIQVLEHVKDSFPGQPSEVLRAQERIAEWQKLAAEAFSKIELDIAELRRMPAPVVRDMILERLGALEERYRGTAEAKRAEKLSGEARGLWEDMARRRAEAEVRDLNEAGKRYFSQNQLWLAQLYLRWVIAADPQGDLAKGAEHILKLIEGRRQRDLNILLQ